MSVGATRRPISALTSVDLPDLIRPATATCSGAPSLRSTSANPAAVREPTCGVSRWQSWATAADSGPGFTGASSHAARPHRVITGNPQGGGNVRLRYDAAPGTGV